MKKKIFYAIVSVLTLIMIVGLIGCTATDKKYLKKVSAYGFWDNTAEQSIAIYKYYQIMDEFLSGSEITRDGEIIGSDGKTKKIAFIGWDGVRADGLLNIFNTTEETENFDGDYNGVAPLSGLNSLKETGGLYLAYCGGEKGKSSEQDTSTAASWTTQFTGVWAENHGVIDNNHEKNDGYDTIFMKYGKLGIQTSLMFDWGELFDNALYKEVEYLTKNKVVSQDVYYKDINRTKAMSVDDMLKIEGKQKTAQLGTENLDVFNYTAVSEVPEDFPYDSIMRDAIIDRINKGDDIVAGIFHNNDSNGHTTGFSNENPNYVNSIRSSDLYTYEILQVIKEREKSKNEDWLIIVANDHGGSEKGHGKQILEHRTNWIACNKPIDSKYFGKGYDGFKEN